MENLEKKTISEIISEIRYFHDVSLYTKSIADYTGYQKKTVSDQYLHVCALIDELAKRINIPTFDQLIQIYSKQ